MKNSWRHFFHRMAATSMVATATAWSSALSYAQIAYDDATDPVYVDGWQAGDNGGFGFEPWNFDSDPGAIPAHMINTDSPFNNLGTAWRIALDPDLTRAGRGFDPLQVGHTLRMVVDNPTETQFFKGFILRLNSGGGNICYGGNPCTPGTTPKERLGIYTFEYFTYGQWLVSDSADDNFQTSLNLTQTDMGLQIDVTLTGAETYDLVMTPLVNPALAYMQSGSLGNAGVGAIDWIEFLFFNTLSDPAFDTDFYIKSLTILGEAAPGAAGDYNDDGTVDAADYTVWHDHLNTAFVLPHEDASPGMVTQEDYDVWKLNFGNVATGSGAAPSAAATVPEPGGFAWAMGVCGAWTLLKMRAVRPKIKAGSVPGSASNSQPSAKNEN